MQKNNHNGHRNRLRNEFVSTTDMSYMPEHKLLEMLLFYGVPRKDTNNIAHELINKFGSFHAVFEADITELCRVSGITRNSAALIKLILPLATTYINSRYSDEQVLKTEEEIGEFLLRKYFACSVEKSSIICLNNMGRVLSFEFVSEGDIESVGLSIRTIVEKALRANATAIILAHNHPGGVALPSNADVKITAELSSALKAVSLQFSDHIIISGNDYISMAQTERYKELFD